LLSFPAPPPKFKESRRIKRKMPNNSGWIKLHREILDWEWYQDANTARLFLHCLLKAGREENKWQGEIIPAGSFVSSTKKLSNELSLTEREIRTAINHLKTTGELTIKTTNKFSVISIINWNIYQQTEIENDKQNDKPLTSNRQATDNKQECKEHKNVKNNMFVIPTIEEIREFCAKRKNKIDPEYFLEYQNARGWKFKTGLPMKSWKATIITWEKNNFNTGGSNGNSAAGFQKPTTAFRGSFKTERDQINDEAGRIADEINREHYAKLAADGKTNNAT